MRRVRTLALSGLCAGACLLPIGETLAADSGPRTLYKGGSLSTELTETTHRVSYGRRIHLVLTKAPPADLVVADHSPADGRRLAEVRVNHARVWIDPDANYFRQYDNPIDDDHHLLAAQRLHHKLTARGAYVVRSPRRESSEQAKARGPIRLFIRKKQRAIPVVPHAPKKSTQQVATIR